MGGQPSHPQILPTFLTVPIRKVKPNAVQGHIHLHFIRSLVYQLLLMNCVGECANFHQVYFVCVRACTLLHCLGSVQELHQTLIMRPSCTLIHSVY